MSGILSHRTEKSSRQMTEFLLGPQPTARCCPSGEPRGAGGRGPAAALPASSGVHLGGAEPCGDLRPL